MKCSLSSTQRWIFAHLARVHDIMGEIPYDFSLATAMKLTQMTCKRSNVHSGHITPTLTFETKNLIIKKWFLSSNHPIKTHRSCCVIRSFHPSKKSTKKTSKSSIDIHLPTGSNGLHQLPGRLTAKKTCIVLYSTVYINNHI